MTLENTMLKERGQAKKKVTYYMIPFIGTIQNSKSTKSHLVIAGGFEGGDVLDICVRVLCMSLRSRSDCLSVFCVLRALKRLFQRFFFDEKTRVF